MSEKAPITAQNLLDGFDEAKKGEEAYVSEAYRTEKGRIAGVEDFSDQARQQLQEQAAYEAYMNKFANLSDDEITARRESIQKGLDNLSTLNANIDAVESGARLDSIDRDIMDFPDLPDEANPGKARKELKFMRNLAIDIAKLKDKHVDESRADRDVQALADKEDALSQRLADFESSLEGGYKIRYDDEIKDLLNRIIELSSSSFAEVKVSPPVDEDEPTPADPDKKDNPTEEEKRLARVAQLRGMSTDDLKKMYAAAYGEKAAEEITDLEELRKLDDEELLRLDARASEEQAKRNADEAEAVKGRAKDVKEYWEKGRKQDLYNRLIDVYRGADKEELKEILIAVYGEEAVLNPAKQKRKRTGWQKISPLAPKGGMNIKAMTKVDDQEALDLMYDAVKGGYRPDVNEISESEVAFMLAEMNAEAIAAEDSLTSEQKRNRDILHHFNNLDDDQMIELMRTMHGEEMVVDNSSKALQRKIARLRSMSDEEKTTYLRTAVDEKNFKLIAETAPQADPEQQTDGYEKNERNQWLINYYREIANNDPKELANLLRKVAGRRSYNKGYKSGEMTVESARLYNDASVLDIMESALDKKYKFVTPMPDFDATSAPISDQPRPQGRVASPNRRPGMRDADVDADEVVSSPADGSATEVIDTSDPRTEPIPIVVQPQPRKKLVERMRDRLRNRGESPDRGNATAGIAKTAVRSFVSGFQSGRERARRNNEEDQTDQQQRRTS